MTRIKLLGAMAGLAIAVWMIPAIPHSQGKNPETSKIEASGLAKYGLDIIGPAHPAFSKLRAGKKNSPSDLFSVFVANNSDQAIASCTLKWEVIWSDGRTVTRYKTKTGELDTVSEGGVTHLSEGIAVKGHLLFSLTDSSSPDNPPQTGIEFSEGGGGPDIADKLSDSVKVKVSVDGVLFVDGTYAGPDSNNNFEMFRGKIEANRELNAEIVQLIDAGAKPEAMISHLERVASIRASEVKSSTGDDPKYLFGKWMQKNSYARLLLAMRKYKGDQAVLDRVRIDMSKPQIQMRRLKES